MKQAWVDNCLLLCGMEADFYSGSRKIIQNLELQFPFECDLTLEDAGYTKMKMRQLERNYLWQESIDAAVSLWNRYRERPKYRSVSFSCYGHFVKDHHGPRGSRMGPCMQSVIITMDDKGKSAEVTVLYRTTEIFKKFPADLVFLKERLLPEFDFSGMTMKPVRCYYVNATIHPAYFVILLPHLEDPIGELNKLKKADPYFWEWVVKWTARYTIEKYGHGIAKFSQALQVKKYATGRITGDRLNELQEYLETNHPGYTRTRFTEGEDDE
jgi:hypothetical protein